MKTFLTAFLCTCISVVLKAQNTDLPGPSPNLQTLPSGSYVIAMDNTLQRNSAGEFNLKAYGLIVYLLNNNARMKWSIKAGKVKDGIDFTALAEQIKPTLIAGGVSRNFKAGPFVITAPDTTGISALIDAFYTSNGLTGANRPQVYRLTADAPGVDIRYDLTAFRPKAAILTDGGNQKIHLAYMTASAIPSASYATSGGTDLLTNCFTFASEPHNDKTGAAVNNAISAIKDFVSKGGNFLAQCDAISNYENNSGGRFQTTLGITISNANIGTTLLYPHPDLSFCQFEGAYNASSGGSVKNWKILGSTANQEHDFATGTGSNTSVIGASVSKHFYAKGGLVFYLGNHSFGTSGLEDINGIRMYMNAFLTPSNTNCPILTYYPLAVRLAQFSGVLQNKTALLNWSVADNQTAERFEVEQSPDGRNFTLCHSVAGTAKNGHETYQFTQPQNTSLLYYRLRIIHKNGQHQYSKVLAMRDDKIKGQDQLVIFDNPVKEDLTFSFSASQKTTITIRLYNSAGLISYSSKLNSIEGLNLVAIPGKYLPAKGSYLVEVIDGSRRYTAKVVKH